MTSPEDALEAARAAAAAARQQGAYGDDLRGMAIEPTDEIARDKLLEWALLEPDVDELYSTRRWGAPITATKRLVLRSLRQYLGQLTAQQTRFNHHITIYASYLEARVRALEADVEELRERRER